MSSRYEELLQALLNGETANIVPRSRVEAALKNCIEGCGCDGLTEPKSRIEAYLQALAEKIKSGESGGEEDDSPLCMVVVVNNSTDPIEVNTKQLALNGELVDFTEMAQGYGEYTMFYDVQKGTVATLKTTLPCIVRDGDNPDTVYSNSEYVEVDEANQMTRITIPEYSENLEIVIGE